MPTIFNRFSQADLPTSLTTVYTAPASTTTSVTLLTLANKSASSLTVDVKVVRSGGTPSLFLVKGAPVPVGGTLDVIDNKPVVLNTGDFIQALASLATSVDVVGSVMEQS